MNARNAREWTANARVRLFLQAGRPEDQTCALFRVRTALPGLRNVAHDPAVPCAGRSIRSTCRRNAPIGGARTDTSEPRVDEPRSLRLRVAALSRVIRDRQGYGQLDRLGTPMREQQAEAAKLDEAIARNLRELGYGR